MDEIKSFLSQAKARTKENAESFLLLHTNKNYGNCIGLLRQELDTLLRLSYLWHEDTPHDESIRLMQLSANGQEWKKITPKGKSIRITDREMVDLATHLGGWEQTIYEFGCKFIHLSDYHLYKTKDPILSLSKETRKMIAGYLSNYHQRQGDDINFKDLMDYLPKIMEKLSDNVTFYIEELEVRFLFKHRKGFGVKKASGSGLAIKQ